MENNDRSIELNTKNYFITYIDILGYQQKVFQDKNNDFLNIIKECVNDADDFV